jgi:hypothetical protein
MSAALGVFDHHEVAAGVDFSLVQPTNTSAALVAAPRLSSPRLCLGQGGSRPS